MITHKSFCAEGKTCDLILTGRNSLHPGSDISNSNSTELTFSLLPVRNKAMKVKYLNVS